ncbi:MAG: tRNA uridine-5-carboxymethylaminomethyl(34) synthesis enzyme MnmG [Planctomycetia bacterium]|nr:MAG: tRNA uridine-5-carboxymethylaminomethyl(34) synthesis enzyme MnmG [Planctomycetia bacterium]
MSNSADVIVIGGGHAGAEAAWSAARTGARTILVTFDPAAIGRMSCNPAIGGIGKGQMVREIDALGGLMGVVADQTAIQFRMLNRSKGPAVWAPRAQSDREEYALAVQEHLRATPGLTIVAGSVLDLCVGRASRELREGRFEAEFVLTGVRLGDGRVLRAACVVVTSGTFLRALMHCGETRTAGGRIGEPAADGLSGSLRALGLELGRLKTGTPPRLARDSPDYSALEEQPPDERPAPFSFLTERVTRPQVPCWITYTNPAVHELIRANLHRAPMYSGAIESRGPRYCPSIEDKVVRFAEKDRHQLFLEPEGLRSDRIYVNGISTSLPRDVQAQVIAGIRGLEHARVLQWGYAVEYDFVPPEQVDATLHVKRVAGLFLAGQINGTSGYEEAAGQGIVAGINAARWAAKRAPVVIRRDQAYLGVMIDDLVTRGVTEPYRMFTSRAEHRLHLRYDNADERLTPLGREIGLVDDRRWRRFAERAGRVAQLLERLERERVEGRPIADWLRRPEEDGARFAALPAVAALASEADVWARAIVCVKYDGYIRRQERAIEALRRVETQTIPAGLDYAGIPHLRREAVERLTAIRPMTLGQASRVSGIHPTDVSLLMVYLASGATSRP